MVSVCFQGKLFNITVIQVYVPTTDAEEAEVDSFYENLEERPSRTNTKKKEKMFYSSSGIGMQK